MKDCALIFFFGLAAAVSAQNIQMKDGRLIVAKSLRRQGNTIIATQEIQLQPDKPPTTGDFGYPLDQIAKLEFPEPAALKLAADLIAVGRGAEAVAQLEPVIRFYEAFRDAPGSWWADAAVLRVTALVNIGKDKEAEPFIDQLTRIATDPEIIRAAKVQQAASATRRGAYQQALPIFESAMKEARRTDTLATAAIYRGHCHLALKQPEPALLSFLEIPVFYPDQKMLQPASLLGCGRAYFAMEDFTRAKDSLNELIKTYAATAEATAAREELEKIEKREKVLAPPAP